MKRILLFGVFSIFVAGLAPYVSAAPKGSVERMDYGPVIGASYSFDSVGTRAERGLAIRLSGDAVAVFDTSILTYVKITEDGEVDLSNTDYMKSKGGGGHLPPVHGEPLVSNEWPPGVNDEPGWADPRSDAAGPLPRSHARFQGYYQHGRKVILSYTAGKGSVLDHPRVVEAGGQSGIARHMFVKNLEETHRFRLFDLHDDASTLRSGETWSLFRQNGRLLGVALAGADARTSLTGLDKGPVAVEVSSGAEPISFRVVVADFSSNKTKAKSALSSLIQASGDVPDLRELTQGGPSLWDETLTREGAVSEADKGYVKDEIGVPKDNPWGSFIRISGLDFFEDGRAAVSTMNGDVWLVSGLDKSLDNVKWKRFATGLYNPLGLSIRDGEIFVLEQGGITRLEDLNGDREADYYERFNHDGPLMPNAYWMNLEHDSKGNFYYIRSGHRAQDRPHQDEYGSLIQVSADGKESSIYAYGFRQANGLGIGPNDVIQTSDQEGHWMPATPIDRVEKGKFYGYQPNAPEGYSGKEFEKPITWLPRGADHSGGGEVFAGDDRWGPLSDHWIHLSWGQARVFVELHEIVNGQRQGGAVRIPVEGFKAGVMRGKVGPHDGQLYVAGVGVPGWTSVSRSLNTFNRIRCTGRPVHIPVDLRTSKEGVQLEFADPLSRKEASNLDNYTVKRWTYKYTSKYGSDEYSIKNPDKTGRDKMKVSEVEVGEDGKEVFLRIPDMKPVRQMMVQYELKGSDGSPVNNRVLFTIHQLR